MEKALFRESIFIYEYILVHAKNKQFHHHVGETGDSV